jgi:glycosyltransferase involved in cell wall biosynthesis
MSTFVTVITPSFNQGDYIEECLRSVKAQSYPYIEHIVIDNQSTDRTTEILARYESEYRLKWISEADSGQANAINKGMNLATGSIICWLNTDDLFFDNNVIARISKFFESHPFIDVVFGNGYIANEMGRILKPIVLKPERLHLRRMRYADHVLQPSTFWRRNDLRLDEQYQYVFDWMFFYQMFERKLSFHYMREFLSVYRMHGKSKTTLDNYKRRHEIFHVENRILGTWHLNTIWCYAVFVSYLISERLNMPIIKVAAKLTNRALAKLTGGRLYSG